MLGAGGVAVVGAGAVAVGESERGRRWLHAAGVLKGPDLSPPDVQAQVTRHVLESRAVRRRVTWAVATPTAPAEAIVVCLHGRNQSHAYAFDTIGMHRFVAAAGLPWAVASVDGGASSYWHERADGTDAQAMVLDEIVPAARRAVGDVPLLLLGWSMGGYGVLLATSDRPTDVVASAAASPAVWRTAGQTTPGAFDSAADFRRHDLFGRVEVLREQRVRIDCGSDDPFAPNVRALTDRIDAEHDFGLGFHDAAYWRSRVPAQLDFFERALSK